MWVNGIWMTSKISHIKSKDQFSWRRSAKPFMHHPIWNSFSGILHLIFFKTEKFLPIISIEILHISFLNSFNYRVECTILNTSQLTNKTFDWNQTKNKHDALVKPWQLSKIEITFMMKVRHRLSQPTTISVAATTGSTTNYQLMFTIEPVMTHKTSVDVYPQCQSF